MPPRLRHTPKDSTEKALKGAILDHLAHSLGKTFEERTPRDLAAALSLALRDRLVDRMLETRDRFRAAGAKRMYYLSIEYLLGRCIGNNICNMRLSESCDKIMHDLGVRLDDIREMERDPALGNGGLGRLAACFLDSLATMHLPGYGYGIHYEYGLFKQAIEKGRQVEKPDYWMADGMPIQLERRDQAVLVPLYGRVEDQHFPDGSYMPTWVDWQDLVGVPYDIPIPGFGGKTALYLRLFAAKASESFDMQIFDQGDYIKSIHQKVYSELISKVLYPSESIAFGKELRLVQEFFLVYCSIRDITRRYLKQNKNMEAFPDYVAIQLNDTHPALSVAELMRVFVDERRLPWERAWELTNRTLAFTNHTLMPESLEMWPVELMQKVLPRHLQIIYEINHRFLQQVEVRFPCDADRLRRMSLIEETPVKQVRMANLAVVGAHSVNGVSALHSELVKTNLFPDYYAMWPNKFNNKTNGITPRRWLYGANPGLASLITDALGEEWVTDLDRLTALEPLSQDPAFADAVAAVKRGNKETLAKYVISTTGISVSPDAAFDIQAKRIHEYKRQLLNVMGIILQYLRIVEDGVIPPSPAVYVFAGKAAPGYFEAKEIIRLILAVGQTINRDKRAADMLKVVFAADYRVTVAEKLAPAADISEQISTAGTEASGTGNMKFSLNGALTVGTLDGANIEIRQAVGPENFSLFGLTTPQVEDLLSRQAYNPWDYHAAHPEIRRVLDALSAGRFTPGDPGAFHWLHDKLLSPNERYLHLADFMSYVQAKDAMFRDYADRRAWTAKSILTTARMGSFSSDRTIAQYARDIWNIAPVLPGCAPEGPTKS
jgi:starch phosphorylase